MVFQAGQGEITAKINADASGFRSGIQSAMAALGGFRGVLGITSGAVVAFAGAKGLLSAVNSAAQFEEQMLSLRSTVGESQQNIESIRESTMELAADTGQATSQITDGWRFARSAGLEMAEAQELVETATKASAAGFGEQNELVRTATTAMNTWSQEVESGSDFLNTMAAAAQNADIRVSEMAGAFRQNVSIASQLNLGLEETLGSLSAISGAAGSASRGGRLLRQVLTQLNAPSKIASESISEAVGSVDNLQKMIQEDGVIEALLELQDNLNENGKEMSDVFRSGRRLEGALNAIANEGARAKDITKQAAEATNTIGKAFEDTDGTLRNWRQTQQEFNNLMIELGNDFLPLVNEGMDAFEATINALKNETVEPFSQLNTHMDRTRQTAQTLDQTLQETSDFRVRGPEIAQRNESFISEDEFSEIRSNINTTLARLEQHDAPDSLMMKLESGISAAINSGFEQGLTGTEIQSRVNTTISQYGQQINDVLSSSVQEGVGEFEDAFSDVGSAPVDSSWFEPWGNAMQDALSDGAKEGSDDAEEEVFKLGTSAKRTLSNNIALAMRNGFEDGSDIGEQILQGMIATATQNLTSSMINSLGSVLENQAGESDENSWANLALQGLNFAFGDTPGVQEVDNDGAVGAFAPGDKFAAAQSMEGLRQQVGASQSGKNVTVQESTTVQFNVDAVDAESVSRLFQQRSDELAGIITDKIDRRSNIQKAVKEASR